jgi:Rps23 Pro-64 3,4-dihydroxylase Tpa1-like proline 4-hydroxylase
MIDFEYLENDLSSMTRRFSKAKPFEHIVIDDFCNHERLKSAVEALAEPEASGVTKSRDYIFAKNKYEKAEFDQISDGFAELKEDLLSRRFSVWLSELTGEEIFVDPDFHGGGLHQGGKGSFLDMHADFNFHPLHPNWFRNVNVLLYLNAGWVPSYGGELKLIDGREPDGEAYKISPIFNRAVVMFTREYTLHGYEPIAFPEGTYRRSIAAYGYSDAVQAGEVRTTVWYPDRGGPLKRLLGRHMPKLVKIKSAILGSGTRRNR